MSETATITCPRCGTTTPTGNRYCGSCGSSVTLDPNRATVSSGAARGDRLSDSGALELRQMLVDAVVGDFEVGEELGRGGMAIVYRATDIHLSRPVAIKILPPDLTYAKGTTERFQREAKTAAALDHPNIIPIYRISSGGKLFWYVMKYLEGRSLAEILTDKGLLTVGETLAILDQVGDALDYAHQRGVVHRDVKPGNVMLDVSGRVTVTDFGIAKELSGSGLTGSGAILGTPYYMSPEQCRGGANLTGAADQYSLAVMAYQMISGQLPFEADSAIDVIHKHVAEAPPPLDALLPGLPKHVINAITRAMSKKAEDRFPTVQSFVSALKNAPADATLMMERRHSPAKLRARPSSGTARSLPAMAGRLVAGLVMVGGLVAGALWLMNRTRAGAENLTQVPPAAPANGAAVNDSTALPAPAGDAAAQPDTHTAAERRQPPSRAAQSRASNAQPGPPASASKGFVRIRITNGYATFAIAGRPIEQARFFADSVAPGTYQVAFARDGWETEHKQIVVTAGRETPVAVTMKQRSQP